MRKTSLSFQSTLKCTYLRQLVTVPAVIFRSIDLILFLLHSLKVLYEFCRLLEFLLLLQGKDEWAEHRSSSPPHLYSWILGRRGMLLRPTRPVKRSSEKWQLKSYGRSSMMRWSEYLIKPGAKYCDCNRRAEQPWDAKSISARRQQSREFSNHGLLIIGTRHNRATFEGDYHFGFRFTLKPALASSQSSTSF